MCMLGKINIQLSITVFHIWKKVIGKWHMLSWQSKHVFLYDKPKRQGLSHEIWNFCWGLGLLIEVPFPVDLFTWQHTKIQYPIWPRLGWTNNISWKNQSKSLQWSWHGIGQWSWHGICQIYIKAGLTGIQLDANSRTKWLNRFMPNQ